MVSSALPVSKVVLTIVLIPIAIVAIASLLAYAYFYLATGGFPPGLFERLLGLNPASIYLLLSLAFSIAILALVTCGCAIYTAIEVYRIHKLIEKP